MSGYVLGRRLKASLRIRNKFVRLGLAEMLGTFVLVAFGCGSVAQSVLSRSANGEFLSINLAWGWAVTFGIFVCGGVSGGHLNPAVTLAMAILGRTPWIQIPIYMIGQYVGAFLGAACVYGVYVDALNAYDGGVRSVVGENATAGIFGTYPQGYLSILEGLWDQVFGTLMLTLCVMAITDKRNMKTAPGLIPICVGSVVTVIGLSFGLNCGYAINPARDLGPRLFTLIAGWGSDVFTVFDYWFWIPIVGPHVGAILGAWIYLLFVGIHLEAEVEDDVQLQSIDNKDTNDHEYVVPTDWERSPMSKTSQYTTAEEMQRLMPHNGSLQLVPRRTEEEQRASRSPATRRHLYPIA